jgi:hypothetical protein
MGCGSYVGAPLGLGFTPIRGEPMVTVLKHIDTWCVCVRESQNFKRVIACCLEERDAMALASAERKRARRQRPIR